MVGALPVINERCGGRGNASHAWARCRSTKGVCCDHQVELFHSRPRRCCGRGSAVVPTVLPHGGAGMDEQPPMHVTPSKWVEITRAMSTSNSSAARCPLPAGYSRTARLGAVVAAPRNVIAVRRSPGTDSCGIYQQCIVLSDTSGVRVPLRRPREDGPRSTAERPAPHSGCTPSQGRPDTRAGRRSAVDRSTRRRVNGIWMPRCTRWIRHRDAGAPTEGATSVGDRGQGCRPE